MSKLPAWRIRKEREEYQRNDEFLPEWQYERGPRHGNNRKWKAKEKWQQRKRSRHSKFKRDEDDI